MVNWSSNEFIDFKSVLRGNSDAELVSTTSLFCFSSNQGLCEGKTYYKTSRINSRKDQAWSDANPVPAASQNRAVGDGIYPLLCSAPLAPKPWYMDNAITRDYNCRSQEDINDA